MFVQNFIALSAAVHELSWSQREKNPTKTILSVAAGEQSKVNASNCMNDVSVGEDFSTLGRRWVSRQRVQDLLQVRRQSLQGRSTHLIH